MSSLAAQVAKNILYFRELRGLSQEDLAAKAQLSRTTLSRYERPEGYEGVTFSALAAIARALEVDEVALISSGAPVEPIKLKPDLWDAALVLAEAVEQYRSGKGSPLIQDLIKRLKSNDAL